MFASQLVYSAGMELETAVQNAFMLGSKDVLVHSALVLRKTIQTAFETSDELRWPPTAEYIEHYRSSNIPATLDSFLKNVFSPRKSRKPLETDKQTGKLGRPGHLQSSDKWRM